MNYTRVALAAVGATIAYFVIGSIVFVMIPQLRDEFSKHKALYRGHDEMMKVMPIAFIAIFVAIVVLAVLYALLYRPGVSGVLQGLHFGVLIGLFVVCAFVLHNYVNLNIGLKLTVEQAVAYFFEWTVVGVVLGLIYKA